MISFANTVSGALIVYSSIMNPIAGHSLMEAGKMTSILSVEIKAGPVSQSVLDIANSVDPDMQQRIIDRVPANYPIFLAAAQNALDNEKYCDGVTDINAEEFAWIMVGHWMKENNLCLGSPDQRCAVSTTGARGPMQFMPGTWSTWGRDGNNDGKISPNSLADSAHAAAPFLCYLRQVTGSWNHAICNYYGDNTETCSYQRGVRRNIDVIKSVLAANASQDNQIAESTK